MSGPSQYALPLELHGRGGPRRIAIGGGNAEVAAALDAADSWPFGTAILFGPARSGKSLLAQWFVEAGHGDAVDDADALDETRLFHRWNRAREQRRPLLLTASARPWNIALPDLRSRLEAALELEIGPPDDDLAAEVIEIHAAQRGLALGAEAPRYLVPRMTRSWAGIERLVAEIDRISLERKGPPGLAVWRAALEAVEGPEAPRLL